MGTGVVLSCGYVHMLQPGSVSLTSPCVPTAFNTTYNSYSYLFAMLAGLVMYFIEFLVAQYIESVHLKKVQTTQECDDCSSTVGVSMVPYPPVVGDGAATPKQSTHSGHSHGGMIELYKTEWSRKKLVEAYLIEFGVTVHSIFIGLAVGVVDYPTLKVLLVALVFHQMLEGVALGARIADADLGLFSEILLPFIFSIAAPLGIGIGIAVINTLNPNGGETFLLVQGSFDSICGGILIYIGFSLLLIDFPRDMTKYCTGKYMRRKQAAMFFFLWLGAGIMAYIGKWL